MGLFSDHDINEIERALNSIDPPIDKKKKILILKGFEKGWKGVNQISAEMERYGYMDEKLREQPKHLWWKIRDRDDLVVYLDFIKQRELDRDPKHFGFKLGGLIGVLRFLPAYPIKNGDKQTLLGISKGINSLRIFPPIHDFVMEVLRGWQYKILEFSRNSDARLYYTATRREQAKVRELYEFFCRKIGLI